MGEDGIHMLHVDDDPSVTDLSATLLEEQGLRVATETNPEAAAERFDPASFDCVVSDYEMPRLDGLDLYRRLRPQFDHADFPCILFTEEGNERVAAEALNVGVTGYLQKGGPEQYDRLASRVESTTTQYQSESGDLHFEALFDNIPDPAAVVDLASGAPVVRRINDASLSQQVGQEVGTTSAEQGAIIAIPAYNEEATIASVVLGAQEYSGQVVVIDDGSDDNTVRLARKAGATVLEQPENRGKGAAVRRAFEFAREHDEDALVVLDGDWQHDPREIPALLDELESSDADIVIGSRYVEGGRGDTPLYRRVGQKVLDAATYLGSGTAVTDSQSGFRAFNETAIEQLDIQATGFGVEMEILRSATDNDLTVSEVPISVNYDVPDANTSNSFIHGFKVVDTLLNIIRDRHPLLFFGVPGLTLTLLGLGYGAWTVTLYQSGAGFYIGKALFSSVLFIIGTFAVFSALIMNMLSRQLQDLQ
jgi:glycosyltransferase involved in cell wall biosynthesis/DNA-binding response OmpR family regulator